MTENRRETTEDRSAPPAAEENPESPDLRIELLGRFRVIIGGRIIPDGEWRLRKAAALVKLLALAPHHSLQRDEVLDALWPDVDPEAAANNLRYTLHVARRLLEPEPRARWRFLTWRRELLVLASDEAAQVDAIAFESSARAARRSGDAAALRQALDLYSGELLPEDRYEDWAAGRRESLREACLSLLLELARRCEAERDYQQATEALRRAIAVEPSLEEAHTALMRLFARIGQRRLALRQYELLSATLRDELDAEPETATQHLYDDILAGRLPSTSLPDAPAVSRPAAARKHNLPVAFTSFIGREPELVEVCRLLADARLVTITGVGGSGKSRLATEAARELVGRYHDGVWLVELAALTDETLVAQVVARVLGVQEQPQNAVLESLTDALRDRELLLLLDNCEHLIDACAGLANALLTACPSLRVLATSRMALDVPGEIAWPLPALSLPLRDVPSIAAMLDAEALQLFVERARYRLPSFELTAENAPAIGDICRRLEGLPLAIELAAARVTVLSPVEIAARLDDALGLLVSSGRLIPLRHRSLRGVLDWSYGLLSEPERSLFAQLAVFAGGCTLEAAEAVASSHGSTTRPSSTPNVLDLLSLLVDKSLVVAQLGDDGATRYGLLEPVRQYAWERLTEREEAEPLRERHARYYLALAETAEPELTGARQREYLARLAGEHDNLRAALTWASEYGRVDVEGRLCAALWRFWGYHSHLIEGERWLAAALARDHFEALPERVRARLLQGAGALAWNRGDLTRAADLSQRALAVFQESADRPGIAATLHILGLIEEWQGNYTDATRRYEESLGLREELGDVAGTAMTLQALGNMAREQGCPGRARDLYNRSLALQRELSNVRGVALALVNLGVVALDAGNYADAADLATDGLELFRELGDKSLIAVALITLGYATLHRGDYQRSLALQAECLRLARDAGDMRGIAYGMEGVAAALALLQPTAAGRERAARLYGAANALRADRRLPLSAPDRALNASSLAAARSTLGQAAFDEDWHAGQALPPTEAIAEALTVADGALGEDGSTTISTASSPLSRREREVAILLARGLTNRQIAEQLGISLRTADTHVRNLLRKLGIASRVQVHAWVAGGGPLPDGR